MRQVQRTLADIADGIVAGAVATWAMGRLTSRLYAMENERAKEREESARGGTTAYEAAAERAASLAGESIGEEERARYGQAVHWALGVGAGVAYAMLRRHEPRMAAAGGLLFGALFWLTADEGAVPALGLTPGPAAFPWQTHARGLAGHLAFGATADAVLDALGPRA